MMLTMMQKKIVFCIIGRPVFSGLFFFSLANYDAFLGGARTGNQQSNSRALSPKSFCWLWPNVYISKGDV